MGIWICHSFPAVFRTVGSSSKHNHRWVTSGRGVPLGPAPRELDARRDIRMIQVVVALFPAGMHGINRGAVRAHSMCVQQMVECGNKVGMVACARHHHQAFAIGLQFHLAAEAAHIRTRLLRILPIRRRQTRISQCNACPAAMLQILLVQIAPGPVTPHDMRDLVRQNCGPETAARTRQPRQATLHIDHAIGRGIGVQLVVFDDSQLPRELAAGGIKNLRDQSIENKTSRGITARSRNALRHELRPQSRRGFHIKLELGGNRRNVGSLLTSRREGTKQTDADHQRTNRFGCAAFHGAPPRRSSVLQIMRSSQLRITRKCSGRRSLVQFGDASSAVRKKS